MPQGVRSTYTTAPTGALYHIKRTKVNGMTFAKKSRTPPVQFAVNYSPAFEALLKEGRVDADLIKCPDWPDLIAQKKAARPVRPKASRAAA